MDKETRNLIFNTTQAIRRLLEEEFALQLEGTFDVHSDGRVEEKAGPQLTPAERLVRRRIVEAIQHRRAASESAVESVRGFQSEAVFTFLNRLAALKLMEARGLVLPCVSQGDQSQGFKEFSGLAPGLIELPDRGYRLYLECLFDEIAREVGVLFDRTDSASQLWPRRKALESLLEKLINPALAGIWAEDETIGWIYQYYNDPDERKKMRDESASPRNSRELAVRNQFFTPRYVVAFLADNTLGRIWYEMCGGATSLKEKCRYLVRRPKEVFLKPGEAAPEEIKQETLSQEQLLKQSVFIPHRPLKDPRAILMIDPACGSMHFGLYAFDLFEAIYTEAWEMEDKPGINSFIRPSGMQSLQETYTTKDVFHKDVPRLIFEHNINGIDIDPRAAQIAGLALWLRAQKAWQKMGIKPVERPAIRRSNIVCAEPMPGEKDLLREFVEKHFSLVERPLFQRLLETVWEKMQLAGEAGSLLKIEEEIRTLVANAKLVWKEGPKFEQASFFPETEVLPRQKAIRLDLSGITDEQFWDRVEDRIYAALRDFAEQAENGGGFQRRLFAEDAARGFAFIDICRKRYDVALMNPPFGEFSLQFRELAAQQFLGGSNDIITAFVERGVQLTAANGLEGVISSRTVFFAPTSARWRQELIVPRGVVTWVELGEGVLDGAMVEVCMYVVGGLPPAHTLFTRPERANGEFCLNDLVTSSSNTVFPVKLETFRALRGWPFAYWLDAQVFWCLENLPSLERTGTKVRVGLQTGDDFRFIRQWAEVASSGLASPDDWLAHAKGGDNSPYYTDIHLVVNWKQQGREVKAQPSVRLNMYSGANPDLYLTPGMTFSYRTNRFSPAALPADCITGVAGMGIFDRVEDLPFLLAFLNSSAVNEFISARLGLLEINALYQAGTIQPTPVPEFKAAERAHLAKVGRQLSCFTGEILRLSETSRLVVSCGSTQTSLRELYDSRSACRTKAIQDALKLFDEVDAIVLHAYGFGQQTSEAISSSGKAEIRCSLESLFEDALPKVGDVLSFALGIAFGRWDIRYATGEQAAPELPDPFAPLPVCPPGQLQNTQGLPARPEDVPAEYPVRIPWDGILVDDENHPLDVIERVREILRVIWKDRAEAIEHEACEILGVKSLRDYFRKPTAFFADHLSRYSKSRRQAPIYWPLSSLNGLYTVWLYYHRLTPDTLFSVLRDHVKPKLEYEERRAFQLRQVAGSAPSPSQRRDIAEAEELVEDLRAFRAELERVALLFRPNLNDGVIINYAPLWRMIRLPRWRKDCQAIWNELAKGDLDWAHLALHLWPERVVPKCATDRSLAIAHGLDNVFWQPDPKAPVKWISKNVPEAEVQKLITARTSPAVKAALETLKNSPVAGAKGPRRNKIGK